MTDRADALRALLEKIEAGTWGGSYEELRRCGLAKNCYGIDRAGPAWEAYNGSLDAALALHEAVLPGVWSCISGPHSMRGGRYVGGAVERYDAHITGGIDGVSTRPSRAWLLAILRALITQEETET